MTSGRAGRLLVVDLHVDDAVPILRQSRWFRNFDPFIPAADLRGEVARIQDIHDLSFSPCAIQERLGYFSACDLRWRLVGAFDSECEGRGEFDFVGRCGGDTSRMCESVPELLHSLVHVNKATQIGVRLNVSCDQCDKSWAISVANAVDRGFPKEITRFRSASLQKTLCEHLVNHFLYMRKRREKPKRKIVNVIAGFRKGNGHTDQVTGVGSGG